MTRPPSHCPAMIAQRGTDLIGQCRAMTSRAARKGRGTPRSTGHER